MSKNADLIAAADQFASAVKSFAGDPAQQQMLLKQADKLRTLLETPMDTVMKQWEIVSRLSAQVDRKNGERAGAC
jgi:hypothetical protein